LKVLKINPQLVNVKNITTCKKKSSKKRIESIFLTILSHLSPTLRKTCKKKSSKKRIERLQERSNVRGYHKKQQQSCKKKSSKKRIERYSSSYVSIFSLKLNFLAKRNPQKRGLKASLSIDVTGKS